MPRYLHDDASVYSSLSHIGIEGVPQIVKSEIPYTGLLAGAPECTPNLFYRVALIGENKVVIDMPDPGKL